MLHTDVVQGSSAFTDLRREWDDLLTQSAQRVHSLRWAWNELWWRIYGENDYRLMLITCRDESGRLIGLAPFYWRQTRTAGIPHLRELLFLGTGVFTQTSQFPDIIARIGHEEVVASSIADFLRARRDWDRLWFAHVPAKSIVLSHFKAGLGDGVMLANEDRSHIVDTTMPWDDLLRTLGKSTRRNAVKSIRRLSEEYELDFRCVQSEAELDTALNHLVRLHQARWTAIGEPGAFAFPRFEQFLREACKMSLAAGTLRLWTLSLNGQVAAAKLAFVENGTAYGFQQGFDPALLKFALGRVMSSLCLKACTNDESVDRFDFMGGDYQYKDSWSDVGIDMVTVSFLRPGIRASIYNAIESATRGAKIFWRALIPTKARRAVRRMLDHRQYAIEQTRGAD